MQRTLVNGTLHTRFKDYAEAIAWAQKPCPPHGNRESMDTSNPTWAGTKNYAEAIRLMTLGWPAGRKRMADAMAIAKKYTRPMVATQINYDVVGAYPEVAFAVAGDPACMYAPDPIDQVNKPVVRIVVSTIYAASVSERAIENFGAALLAAIDLLESEQFPVELVAMNVTIDNKKRVIFEIPLKAAGQHLDVDRLAFALAHPSFGRRIGFRFLELDPLMGPITDDYGRPTDPNPKELDGGIWIEGPTHYSSQGFASVASATKLIEDALDKAMSQKFAAHYDLSLSA